MAKIWNRMINSLRQLYYRQAIDPLITRMGITHCMPKTETEFVFEVSLAEHCDLNCVGCAHFSPLAEPEFADYEEAARDFARLSSLFHGHIKEVRLMGGEPLLHPELAKFPKMARENFPDASIIIVTNGLKLLNQPEEFWLACREYNIVIRPTKYPIPLKYEEMEKCAADHGVEYRYYCGTGTVLRKMNLYKLDVKGLQDSRRNFLFCYQANDCVNLWHGRLYTCPVAPTARHFNKYFGEDLKDAPENSIDIYQAGSAREILEFLAKPIPFCRYCMIDKTKWNQPWRQSKRAIEEWT